MHDKVNWHIVHVNTFIYFFMSSVHADMYVHMCPLQISIADISGDAAVFSGWLCAADRPREAGLVSTLPFLTPSPLAHAHCTVWGEPSSFVLECMICI